MAFYYLDLNRDYANINKLEFWNEKPKDHFRTNSELLGLSLLNFFVCLKDFLKETNLGNLALLADFAADLKAEGFADRDNFARIPKKAVFESLAWMNGTLSDFDAMPKKAKNAELQYQFKLLQKLANGGLVELLEFLEVI